MWPFPKSQPSTIEDDAVTAASSRRLLEEPAVKSSDAAEIESPASLARGDDFHFTGYPNERLSMPPSIRWPVMFAVSFSYGFSLGATIGGRRAADRYRAMNAHRLPETQAGWYLYHRSKSYHTTVGGVKEGVRFGGVLSIWATIFMLAEEGLDQARGRLFARKDEEAAPGQRDFANTTMAALTTVGLYSRWHRMDVFATTKMGSMAFRTGIIYGVVQDAVSTLRGEPPAYLGWFKRKVFGFGDR